MTIGLPTFVAVILAFISVMFVVLVIGRKPSESEIERMKEAGMEVAKEIQKSAEMYLSKIEKQQKEIDKKLEQAKRIQYAAGGKEAGEEAAIARKSGRAGADILELHREGYTVDQISKILNVQRGVVEVALNMSSLHSSS